MCLLFFVAAVALCVRVRGPTQKNTVKRIVTLHWIQTYLLYIYIYQIHLKKVSIQMNL